MSNRNAVLSLFGLDPIRIGNGEHFVHELSRQLAEIGWESIVCFANTPPEPVRRFLALPNVKLEVVETPWSPTRGNAAAVARLLNQYRPRVFHQHYTSFLGPFPWLARLHGVERVFYNDHSSRPFGHEPKRYPLWKRIITRAVNFPIDSVICVSDYGHRCTEAMDLLPASRVCRIYNGIDLPEGVPAPDLGAAFRRKCGIPADRVLVVQVSWMIPEKGIGDLIDAAKIVVGRNPRVHFAMVGEGAAREQFTRQAADAGLGGHFTWTGLVQDPFGEGVYAAADMVCQVSRWEEVFGCTIVEAMSSYRPLVVTRVGGIPEIVQDGRTGFVVPRGDAAAMAESILRLAADEGLRARMGAEGRRVSEAKFDLRDRIADLLRLYGANR